MTIEQFALLNVGWAAAIVLLEVPSGALADYIGRRMMLLAASSLMILEMLLLAFMPLGNVTLVFNLLLLNRILSGAAEASASGADEALAYDTLKEAGREKEWPDVLASLMKWQSMAFIIAMLCGAMAYDDKLVNQLLSFVSSSAVLSPEVCHRIPVYLTLLMSLGAWWVCLQMKELGRSERLERSSRFKLREPLSLMLEAGRWIGARPFILFLMFYLVMCDSIVRLHLTLGSQYLRLIQIPEAWFGFFSAAFAGLGLVVPRLAKFLVEKRSWSWNLSALGIYLLISLAGLSLALPYFGLIFSVLTSSAMFFLGFYSSHYLNQAVDSKKRATVLSFKGLSVNLGYGLIGLSYAAYVAQLNGASKESAYAESIKIWPWYFAAVLLILGTSAWIFRNSLRASAPTYELSKK